MIGSANIIINLISVAIGIISGIYAAWGAVRYYDEETVFTKRFFKEFKLGIPRIYTFIVLNVLINLFVVYRYGNFFDNNGIFSLIKLVEYIKYIILVPFLLITFFVDLDYRVIPNRVTMLMLQIGIIFLAFAGFTNSLLAKDLVLGMFAGFGMFAGLALLGGLFAGKEAMGIGDIKFMTPLGLLIGLTGIINTTLLAFIIAAIFSIAIIIIRKIKGNKDEYVPFGPFLVIAAIIVILLPEPNMVVEAFLEFSKYISTILIGIGG